MNWKQILLAVAVVLPVAAQQTNAPAKTDYAFFKLIPDRNIFNPNRYPQRAGPRRNESVRSAPVDTLVLVGTLSSAKGTYAFFDGTSEEYRKVLERDGAVAGCKLMAILPQSATVLVGEKTIELKVGAQLRRGEDGAWQPAGETELPVATSSAPVSTPASEPAVEPNDVLKKLMQQREQELK